MAKEQILDQARFIFSVGRALHGRLMRLNAAMDSGECLRGPLGELSMAQTRAVIMVDEHGELSITDLANMLSVSPPSASVMVDRLVERGILIREPSSRDRRKVAVRLSPNTQDHIREMETHMLGTLIDIVEKIGPDTTRKWCEVLTVVEAALNGNPLPVKGSGMPSTSGNNR